MAVDWEGILLAYLHDPPDKALSIRGHVRRAQNNAQIAVGDHVSRRALEDAVSAADPMASIIERCPMPTAGSDGQRAVEPQDGSLCIIHPLSTTPKALNVPELDEKLIRAEQDQLHAILAGLPGQGGEETRNRFLAIWRLWPGALAMKVNRCLAHPPADTRTPDHSIWNHLDITAAFKAAAAEAHGAGLLVFVLGPVQRFIETARSVRDLWSGSMILSWLAFRAMLPVIEQLGPTALVYPALRGNPLMDLWLREGQRLGDKLPLPEVARRLTPSLPHRFLALMPWGTDGSTAEALAEECRKAVMCAWQEMANAVRRRLKRRLDLLFADWDKRWDDQVRQYFRTTTAVVPLAGPGEEVDKLLAQLLAGNDSFAEAFKAAAAVREMARSIPADDRPGYAQDHAGRWQYQVELVNRSLAAQRAIDYVPANRHDADTDERFPQKCTLLGTLEQMGPDDLARSKEFWERAVDSQSGLSVDGVRLRKGEALCAVTMVKRFAGPSILAKELEVGTAELRFPDTWTIAGAEWLDRAEMDPERIRKKHGEWNGRWLHESTVRPDPAEPKCPAAVLKILENARAKLRRPPPVYYAILKLDGDDLGAWLRGERSPKVRDVMHPDLVRYYEKLGEPAIRGLDARRPVGPALHTAISTALANLALYAVPEIVRRHHGTAIYSGGDDTLMLLPTRPALTCALKLRRAYMSNWWRPNEQSGQQGSQREYLMMGSRATLSGGLVVVHAKDDLRLALQDARRAERRAKDAGKDALFIVVRRRSGEHTEALCPWDFVPTVENWRRQFAAGASSRWARHLFTERTTLKGLCLEAVKAEMRRQLGRAEAPTPTLIPPEQFAEGFDRFRQSSVGTPNGRRARFESPEDALEQFLTLCLTASFLARGRDE